MQIPPFVSLCKYGFWSHEQTHSIHSSRRMNQSDWLKHQYHWVSCLFDVIYTLEGIQKKALSIIYPESSYDVTLKRSNLTTMVSRWADACRRVQPTNPLYNIIKYNCAVRLDKPYDLRHKSEAKVPYNTIRFKNFITSKYS